MFYCRSFKLGNPTGVRLAHCSDCSHWIRKSDKTFYLGYCSFQSHDCNCNTIPCDSFSYRYDWLKPKDNVKQLNLFDYA